MNVHLFRSFYLFFLIAICLHCTVRYCISVSWEEGRKWSTFTQVSHSKAWWQEMTFSCTVVEECNLCRRAAADLCLHLRLLQVWSQLLCRMSPQGGSLGADCLWELCRESSPVIPVDCCFILFLSNQFDMLFLEMLLRQHSMENVLVFFFFFKQARLLSFSKCLNSLFVSLAGYWPSYNIPFHQKIYNLSGYASYVEKYGLDFSYELAPRAKIFRRDQGKVTNLESMKYIMRYNSKKYILVFWSWS